MIERNRRSNAMDALNKISIQRGLYTPTSPDDVQEVNLQDKCFTADRPPGTTGGRGGVSQRRQRERSSYVHTCNTNAPQVGTLNDLASYHADNDIVFFGDMLDLTQPSKAYKAHVQRFTNLKDDEIDEATEAKLIDYSGVQCEETGTAVYYPRCKGGKYSAYQRMKSVSSNARRLASRLCLLPDLVDAKDSLYIMAQDLTFPQHISQMALTDFEGAVTLADKCAKAYVKELSKMKRWDRHKDNKLMYFYNIHIWHSHKEGSEYAVTEPHLHIHLNIVNALFDKNGISKRFEPFIQRKTVKEAWVNVLAKKDIIVPEPDFYLRFISLKHRAQVVHRIKYCGRSVLVDLHGYYKEHSYDPEMPEGFNFMLLRYKNARHSCGALRKLKDYVGPIGGGLEDEATCPIDAHKAVYLGKFSQIEIEQRVEQDGLMVAYWSQKLRKMVFIGGNQAQQRLTFFDGVS